MKSGGREGRKRGGVVCACGSGSGSGSGGGGGGGEGICVCGERREGRRGEEGGEGRGRAGERRKGTGGRGRPTWYRLRVCMECPMIAITHLQLRIGISGPQQKNHSVMTQQTNP